ncbi:hypothetical protein, partial [Photobacterium halotolerans]|uniref:hypothetical protein n=1 Tax=Photobacterium halotolerans TaxID=265726 RepID=UPI001F36C3E7
PGHGDQLMRLSLTFRWKYKGTWGGTANYFYDQSSSFHSDICLCLRNALNLTGGKTKGIQSF